MIYFTGDMHGDLSRFKDKRLSKLRKGDSLIVCGDFGFIWDGSDREARRLKRLGKKKYNILFVDGAHENFELLNSYPVSEWHGGNVRVISGRLMQLCRGGVYDIDGKKVFAFGGGLSPESELGFDELERNSFSEAALPTDDDIEYAIENLKSAQMRVDYIVSYEPPSALEEFVHDDQTEVFLKSHLNKFFDEVVRCVDFKKWVFGKCHKNKTVSHKYSAVYTTVICFDKMKK